MIRAFIICLFALCAFSCAKESDIEIKSASIKLMQTPSDYLARSIVSLPDGSVVMGSVAFEDHLAGGAYGLKPALLARYDVEGELNWMIELPKEVYVLWKCMALDNGNILAVGFDDTPESKHVGALIISAEGEVQHLTSIFNDVPNSLGSNLNFNSVDVVQMQNGTILLVLPHNFNSTSILMPRIIILDAALSVVEDISYDYLQDIGQVYQLSCAQALNGDVFVSGRIIAISDSLVLPFAFIIKLNSALETIYYTTLSAAQTPFETGGLFDVGRTEIPSNIAIGANGFPVIVASNRYPGDSLFEPIFNLRNQDYFMRAPRLNLWQTNDQDAVVSAGQVTGFQDNAVIQKIKNTSDGGLIMVGTAGINNNQAIPSQYRLLVIKTDAAFNVQWKYQPQWPFATLGADIAESPGGYLVTATQHSFGEINQPLFLRLNQSGILE